MRKIKFVKIVHMSYKLGLKYRDKYCDGPLESSKSSSLVSSFTFITPRLETTILETTRLETTRLLTAIKPPNTQPDHQNMFNDVELYELLDKLILQAETTENSTENSNENSDSELLSEISGWSEDKVKEMASMCNTVLTDLDSQYSLIEQKIHNEQKHSRRRHYSTLEEAACELEIESERLAERESSLHASLAQLEVDVRRKEKELQDIEQQLSRQVAIEENFTSDYFDLKLDYIQHKKERESIDFRHRYIRALSNKLQKINIFSLVFQITQNDNSKSSAINGFKLSAETTENNETNWSDVNCAWGQLSLLLNGLLHKLSLSKSDIRVIPMGPWSYVEKSESGSIEKLPLYHSSSIKSFFKGEKKFQEACRAMVDCFEFVAKEGLNLEYKRQEGQIVGKGRNSCLPNKWTSIKKQFNDKKYSDAGRSLLRNVAKMLQDDKLNG